MADENDPTTETEAAIGEQIAAGVSSVSVDGVSTSYVEPEKRLDALDELNKQQARRKAADQPHFGLRFTRLVPPGTG